MSYVQNYIHIVFSTKYREMVIPTEYDHLLYMYIKSFFRNKKSSAIAINGIPNHVHILVNVNPTYALSSLIGDLKRATSLWLKSDPHFPMFKGWQDEYAAFNISYSHVEVVKNYILSQKDHHAHVKFEDEYQRLVLKNGLTMYNPERK